VLARGPLAAGLAEVVAAVRGADGDDDIAVIAIRARR
jgi:hypothetical protein